MQRASFIKRGARQAGSRFAKSQVSPRGATGTQERGCGKMGQTAFFAARRVTRSKFTKRKRCQSLFSARVRAPRHAPSQFPAAENVPSLRMGLRMG
jgi:hypothetical protein